MTDYQQNFVERLERAAEETLEAGKVTHRAFAPAHIKEAKAFEKMAEQFKAGDYDPELMARVVMLFEDDDMRDDAFTIADRVVSMMTGANSWLFDKADDLLAEILDQMRSLYELTNEEADAGATASAN